jgi:PAS domain S-box-containing protein
MRKHSDGTPDWDDQRKKIIGLGETSVRKSYFPELQQQIRELEKKNEELHAAYEELTATDEELREQYEEVSHKEQELRESEERFRNLIEASPLPIVLVREGLFVYCNRAFCTMTGYETPDEVTGKPLLDFVAPEMREKVAGYVRARSLEEPAPPHYESVGLRKEGSRFPYEVTIAVIRLPEGLTTMAFITDISGRKDAEAALLKGRERLRRAELVAGLGHWEFNLVSGRVFASDGARRLYGLSGETWSIPEVQKVPLPEYRPMLDEALRALVAENRPYDVEFRIRRPDDGQIMAVHSIAEYDPAAQVVFGVIQDITERKQNEETLREREEFLTSIVENLPLMLFVKDAQDLRFVRFNKAGEDLLGYSRKDLIGKNDHDFFMKEQADFFTRKDREVLYGKVPVDIPEEEIGTRVLGTRTLHTRKIPILDKSGEPRYLLGISEDITDRKKALEAMRSNEKKFRDIVETSPDIIWEVDLAGNFTYLSPRIQELLGYMAEDLIGKAFFSLLAPEQVPVVAEVFKKHRVGTEPGLTLDVIARHANGQLRDMEIRSVSEMDADGRMVGFRGITRDITDRKYQERTLKGQLDLGIALQKIHGLAETLDICLSAAIGISEMDSGGIYLVSKQDGSLALAVSRNLAEDFVQCISRFPADSERAKLVMKGKPVYSMYSQTGVVHTPVHEREGLRAIAILPIMSGGRIVASLNVASHTWDEIGPGARIALETICSQIGSAIEQKMAEDALLVSEERYRSLVNITDTGYVMLDNHGLVIDANDVYVRLTGRSALTDILGHTVNDWTAPYDLERNAREVEQCFRTGTVHGLEIDYLQPDGTIKPVEINATVFHTGDQDVVLTLCRDISDRKRINVALQQARNKLNLLNAVTFQDIQTAAFSLSAYQELVKTVLADPKARSYLEKQELFLKKMIDTLDFAKNYQEMGIHQPRWQNVRQVFLYAISHLDFLKMKQNLLLDNLEIFSDPLFEKALFNIMENVLRHGVSATEVSLRYEEKKDYLLLVIEDNGVGIPPEEKNMIFDRGYGKGSGLGLFLVREVLSITGMTIRETGVRDKGTRFEIMVPRGVYRFAGNESGTGSSPGTR